MSDGEPRRKAQTFGFTRLLLWRSDDIEAGLEDFQFRVAGTGFLVRWHDIPVLVTARHVFFSEHTDKRTLCIVGDHNGTSIRPLHPIDHANISPPETGNGTPAQDITIFELDRRDNELLQGEYIPQMLVPQSMDFAPAKGVPLVAQGFPFNLPNKQMDYDRGEITPRRLDLYGHCLGEHEYPAMQSMHVPSNWINLDKVVVPLKMPDAVNGMCGGPVLTNASNAPQRLAGMTIMAGQDLIGYIDIELIWKFIMAWMGQKYPNYQIGA
jgi:hypothetical protein